MIKKSDLPQIGTPMQGGYFTGCILIAGVLHGIVTAPKLEGELEGKWSSSSKSVAGAMSYCDGMANTVAMVEAGSVLAASIRALSIGGFDDWYLPSQDEQEIQYRAFKPTSETNTLYARSGVNASAVPPTHPYAEDAPAQTAIAAFQAGGEQAFEDAWYWSSTQHADGSDFAWGQYFGNGSQVNDFKSAAGRARAVRRFVIL